MLPSRRPWIWYRRRGGGTKNSGRRWMARPAGAPSYQLTCLNLRILKKITWFVYSPVWSWRSNERRKFQVWFKTFFYNKAAFWDLGAWGVWGTRVPANQMVTLHLSAPLRGPRMTEAPLWTRVEWARQQASCPIVSSASRCQHWTHHNLTSLAWGHHLPFLVLSGPNTPAFWSWWPGRQPCPPPVWSLAAPAGPEWTWLGQLVMVPTVGSQFCLLHLPRMETTESRFSLNNSECV